MRHVKSFFALLLCAALLLAGVGAAAEGGANPTLRLPESTEVIGPEAFYGLRELRTVILPEDIQKIGSRAFANSGLWEINLPASLTEISDDAFEGCEDLTTIYALRGSYAYDWAVRNGYITEVKALRLTLSRDIVQPRIGDTVTWRARASYGRGVGQYLYSFALTLNGRTLAVQEVDQEAGEAAQFTFTLPEEGSCRLAVTVSDVEDGETLDEVETENTFTALPEKLAFKIPKVEVSEFLGAKTYVWTMGATGGHTPYQFSFDLYRDGELEAQRKPSASATYAYTLYKVGDYALEASVTSDDGQREETRLEFTPEIVIGNVQAKIRTYVPVDKSGKPLTGEAGKGHYELQLGTLRQKVAFDEHLFIDPVFSFGPGTNDKGVVTVFDSATAAGKKTVTSTSDRYLYTFEFTTTTDKVLALMYELLAETWLNTDSEGNRSNSTYSKYDYDVKSGTFVKYRIQTQNCFTAMAAWTMFLGYGTPTIIVEDSSSYKDYYAWQMYTKYGSSWTKE